MALTKVTGHVIKSDTNIISHNINSSGIITAVTFDGNVSGVAVTFTGDSTIGSLGITTNLTVGGNIDVDGHTDLDNVSVAGVTTFSDDVIFNGANFDITYDRSINTFNFDQSFLKFGTSGQLVFRSTGPFSTIDSTAGLIMTVSSLEVKQTSGDKMIKTYNNGAVELYHDDNLKFQTTNTGAVVSGILTVTGNMNVEGVLTYQDVTNIDSIGIVTARSGVNITGGNITLGDSGGDSEDKLVFGADGDLKIFHNGTNNYIDVAAGSGHLYVRPKNNFYIQDYTNGEVWIAGILNGAVKLYHNGIEKLTTTGYGVTVTGITSATSFTASESGVNGEYLRNQIKWDRNSYNYIDCTNDSGQFAIRMGSSQTAAFSIDTSADTIFPTNRKIKMSSDKLQLYHDGSHGYVKETNGDLYLQSTADDIIIRAADNISIQAQGGEYCIDGNGNGSVNLYYDGGTYTTPKLKTSATGIEVHGEVDASQDYPLTKPVLDFNFAAEKKLDPRFQFTRESIATFVDKKGIIQYASDNIPRFDHHPTSGVSLGLLLEREQTNYQEYSVLMSQSNIKNNITVTDNFAISPDGTQNASKIVNATSNNAQTNIAWNGTSVPNNQYAMWSIWLKSEETSCIIQIFSNTYIFGADRINIELADGTYDGTSASSTFRFNIEKYPNKWWRISVGGNGANAAGGWYIGVVDSKTAARGATCGSATNKTWFAWGVQEEIGTLSRIATSYIPTHGAAVTRKGDRVTMDGDDFDDFFDRFQGTVINEHSNALQSIEGGGSGWEFNNDQLQVNLIAQTGSGYAHSHYPGCQASVFGDRNSGGSGGSGSPGTDYIQLYGPNSTIVNGGIQNGAANSGYGRYPGNLGGSTDYTRYYKTWTDAMSYDLTPSTNILRTATGGETTEGTNTQSISLANVSKFELGNDATDLLYSNFFGRIKRWVYYDKVLPLSQLANLTSQLPQSYL